MSNLFFEVEDKGAEKLKDERAIIHYITTPDIDRGKDIVNPRGMVSTEFEKTRTVFFNHDYNLPIARNDSLRRSDDGVKAKTIFSKTKFADDVYTMHLEDVLRGWSIGFMPGDGKDAVSYDDKRGIRVFNSWNLIEYSSATIPMNPNAIDQAKSIVKSLEGQAFVQNFKTEYEMRSLIGEQSKEIQALRVMLESLSVSKYDDTEIRGLIKNYDDTEIKREIEEIKNNLLTEIKNNIETVNQKVSGIKQINPESFIKVVLPEMATGLMRSLDSKMDSKIDDKLERAFLKLLGKRIN